MKAGSLLPDVSVSVTLYQLNSRTHYYVHVYLFVYKVFLAEADESEHSFVIVITHLSRPATNLLMTRYVYNMRITFQNTQADILRNYDFEH